MQDLNLYDYVMICCTFYWDAFKGAEQDIWRYQSGN